MAETSPVRVERSGAALVLTLDRPKANILDRAMMAGVAEALAQVGDRTVKAVVLQAAGTHFSFGASVEEHQPDQAPKMLATFHALMKQLLRLPVPLVCAVRGQCLGGALELILPSSYVALAPGAKLGQPEVKLAAFAPFASVMLPAKVGQGRAERLLLSGAVLDAQTAVAWGLADLVTDEPERAALAWVTEQLAPLSRVAIEHALRAARVELVPRAEAALDTLEAQYVGELLATHDAKEGITAFLQKRAPSWKNC